MPHSSFAPLQRPDLGSAPSAGIAVQGAQPMLRYPRSYNGRYSIFWSIVYCHTCGHVQKANGLIFCNTFPPGSVCCSITCKFLRVGDCSRRSPVNQTSNGSKTSSSGSTLRSWQQRVGSVWFKIPNWDSCSATVCLALAL